MVRTLVQLSDLHIVAPGRLVGGRVDTARCLRDALESVDRLAQAPEAIVITGDLTDTGLPGEYAHLRELLGGLRCPVYLFPGNHDDRATLREAFADHAHLQGAAGFVQYAVDLGGLRLVTVDTVVPRASHGAVDRERLAHAARLLADAAGTPTIVAMHHPPFPTFVEHMDAIGLLQGTEELAALIGAAPHIERVICGHLHRSIQARWAGTLAMCAPSTAHQIALDLRVRVPAAYTMEPPGFLVHAWDDAGRVASHHVAVGRFAGPYPFDEDNPHAR